MNRQAAPAESTGQPPQGTELRIDEAALNIQFDELWRPDSPSSLPRGPESVLLAAGAITQADLEAADARRRENPHLTIMQALQKLGVIDETAALRATADYFKLPFREIGGDDIDERTYQMLPAEFIKGKSVIPIRNEDGTILVGMA